MSSSENPSESNLTFSFNELLSAEMRYDAGLIYFDQKMAAAQKDLRDRISDTKTGYDEEAVEMYEEDLNALWQHEGQVGTLTGLVHLTLPEMKGLIPEGWTVENSVIADEGEVVSYSYFVEGAKLRSHGVEVIPAYDETSDKVVDIQTAYMFALADDDFDRPILRIFPGELSSHIYETPTTIEAGQRIHREWPEEAQLIDRLIKPGEVESLPARLAMLTRRLQSKLLDSDHFREVVQLYVNGRMELKQDLPYLLNLTDTMMIFEGGDINDDATMYDWTRYSLVEPFTTMAYAPQLQFIEELHGVEANIFASTYSEESANEPDYLRVPVGSIELFRAMFAKRSLGSLALMSNHLRAITADEIHRNLGMLEAPDPQQAKLEVVPHRKESTPQYNSRIRTIFETEMMLKRLEDVYRHVREEQKTIYATEEDAAQAAMKIIENLITPAIDGLLHGGMQMEFSGPGILKPNAKIAKLPVDDETQASILALHVDYKKRHIPLEAGDWVIAYPYGIEPNIREQQTEDGKVTGYSAFPSLIATLPVDQKTLMNWQGIDMVNVQVEQKIFVALDGSAHIQNKSVKLFHQANETFQTLSEQHRGEPIVKKMYRLRRALLTEDPDDVIQLMDAGIIVNAARAVEQISHSGGNDRTAIKSLEILLNNRVLRMTAEAYGQTDDGTLARLDSEGFESSFVMTSTDVRNDILGARPVIVGQIHDGPYAYVPIDTISAFYF